MGAQSLTVMTYNIRLDVASDGENDWTTAKTNWQHKFNSMRQAF
jgi:hypothetical protein